MAEHDLFEAFNDCIDRMNAGESLDDCIKDYPQFADRLRQLLDTVALVHRAQQYPAAEMNADQEETRSKIAVMSFQLPERKSSFVRQGWFYAATGLVALFVIVMIGSLLLISFNDSAPTPIDLTRAFIQNTNAIVVAQLAATQTTAPVLALTQTADANHSSQQVGSQAQAGQQAQSSGQIGQQQQGTYYPTASPSGTAAPTATPLPAILEIPGTPAPILTPFAPLSPIGTATLLNLLPPPIEQAATADGAYFTPTPPQPSFSDIALTATALVPLLVPPGQGGLIPTAETCICIPATPSLPALVVQPTNSIIPLNAGEIDDNAHWDDYLQYRSNYLQQYGGGTVHDVDITGGQLITVSDQQGLPVLGADVRVYAGQTLVSESRTYATGQTLFFPNASVQSREAQTYGVHVEKDNDAVEFMLDPSHGSSWNVALSGANSAQVVSKLDVLFLLDSTGSMGDEIAQLQNNILAISSQVAQFAGNSVSVRYGLVTYRDRGDAYVTQIDDFVPDVSVFQATLSRVKADGGGDTPESLNEGLHDAVQEVSWRGDDAIKLIFLVADAPPHLDYPNDYDYAQEMVVAAQRGIKIHPLASSGLPPDGEYIFRQLAEYTMGHFLFLTYQQGTTSGAPGDTRSDLQVGTPASPANQGQGDYTVEHLDDLVLRLIADELAAPKQLVNTRNGINAVLTPAAVLPAQSGSLPPPATPVPASTQTSQLMPSDPQITVSLPLLLSLIMGGVVIGYAVNTRRTVPKRKRKREEIVEPED